jgi:large subunit ribosomal protein L22
MQALAKAKGVRHGALKLRQVADLVRGKSVDEALATLSVLKNTRKGAVIVENVLKSAVANFQNSEKGANAGTENLKVATITVDGGPLMKRIRARAQGRAFRIHKALSHVTVVVADTE